MTTRNIIKGACKGSFISMAILALLEPFGIDQIEEYRLLFIFCEGVIAVAVSMFSVYMAQLCINFQNDAHTSRWRIAVDNLIIHLFNIPLLSATLLSFNSWMHTNSILTYWMNQGEFSLSGYEYMILSVATISIFVYVVQLYQVFNDRLQSQLDEVMSINELLTTRLDRMQQEMEAIHQDSTDDITPEPISLESTSGGVILTIIPSDIVYIESMSNYADVCYMSNGEVCHRQLRTTMKQLRERLTDFDYLISCHRAYIVNLNFVSSLSMRSGSDYYQLSIFGQEKQIPVSRANTDEIRKRLK